jgi:hypothetical protein
MAENLPYCDARLICRIIVEVLEDRFGTALTLTGICIDLVIGIITVSRRHRLRVDRFGVRVRLRLRPTFPRAALPTDNRAQHKVLT